MPLSVFTLIFRCELIIDIFDEEETFPISPLPYSITNILINNVDYCIVRYPCRD